MMVERRAAAQASAKRERWSEYKARGSKATDNANAKHKDWGSEATKNVNTKREVWGSEATESTGHMSYLHLLGISFFMFLLYRTLTRIKQIEIISFFFFFTITK